MFSWTEHLDRILNYIPQMIFSFSYFFIWKAWHTHCSLEDSVLLGYDVASVVNWSILPIDAASYPKRTKPQLRRRKNLKTRTIFSFLDFYCARGLMHACPLPSKKYSYRSFFPYIGLMTGFVKDWAILSLLFWRATLN